jgi:mannose-6-phosphate isomerase-like protein (cupin superfamily)
MTEQRELGGVGTRVLFENDRVRIWELRLEPGQDSAVHRHELDHVLVLVSGDRIAVEPEPDTGGPYKEHIEADVKPGAAVFVRRGGVETARNVGRQPYHEVIVELKD